MIDEGKLGDSQQIAVANAERDKLIKALGMLGSVHEGEALNAARQTEHTQSNRRKSWRRGSAARCAPRLTRFPALLAAVVSRSVQIASSGRSRWLHAL
jgi:hypothetical protein